MMTTRKTVKKRDLNDSDRGLSALGLRFILVVVSCLFLFVVVALSVSCVPARSVCSARTHSYILGAVAAIILTQGTFIVMYVCLLNCTL